jgi:hypothetical protein
MVMLTLNTLIELSILLIFFKPAYIRLYIMVLFCNMGSTYSARFELLSTHRYVLHYPKKIGHGFLWVYLFFWSFGHVVSFAG